MRRGWEAWGTWDFLSAIFGNGVFLLFISLFWIPPPSSCHSLAVKMKSCPWCVHNNGSLCRPHGSCSLIYFNSFYIEPNDLICHFLMESLQQAGWEPNPLPKEWWAQLSLELGPSWVSLSQLRGGRDTSSHRWDPSGNSPELGDQSDAGVTFLFLLFSPIHKLFLPSLTGVSQPFLVPLFSSLVWNLGKSGIVLSNFQSSLVFWRSCLQRYWFSELLRLGELCLVASSS